MRQGIILVGRHWVDHWVVVEDRHIRIVILDEANSRVVVRGQMYTSRPAVIKVWEGDLVLCSDLMSDNDFVDIIKLIPVFIFLVDIAVEGLKLGSAWYRQIESFSCIERLLVEKIEVVLVGEIGK